jgi:hypothetical protein
MNIKQKSARASHLPLIKLLPIDIIWFEMRSIIKFIFGGIAIISVVIICISFWAMYEMNTMSREDIRQLAKASELPEFSMRGLKRGVSPEQAKRLGVVQDCSGVGSEDLVCHLTATEVAGVNTLYTNVTFKTDAFHSVYAVFSQTRFAAVAETLSGAYNKPCQIEVKKLQNAFNAKYTSIEMTWCFKNGEMTLIERSETDFRESIMIFAFDTPAEPKKNLTRDSI